MSATITVAAFPATLVGATASVSGVRTPIGSAVAVDPGEVAVTVGFAARAGRTRVDGLVRLAVPVADGQSVVVDCGSVLWLFVALRTLAG